MSRMVLFGTMVTTLWVMTGSSSSSSSSGSRAWACRLNVVTVLAANDMDRLPARDEEGAEREGDETVREVGNRGIPPSPSIRLFAPSARRKPAAGSRQQTTVGERIRQDLPGVPPLPPSSLFGRSTHITGGVRHCEVISAEGSDHAQVKSVVPFLCPSPLAIALAERGF